MKNWINFSSVEKWEYQNAGASDCTAKCRKCDLKWHDIKLQGRGAEMIHMIQLKPEETTPCGLNIAFECDTCYKLTQP